MVRLPNTHRIRVPFCGSFLRKGILPLFFLSMFVNESWALCTYQTISGVRVMENQVCTEQVEIDGSGWDGAIIRNNIFRNQSGYGMRVKDVRNVTIQNNEFYGMQINAILLRTEQSVGTDNVVIRDNFFHDMPSTAIYVGEPNRTTKILDNTFENVGNNTNSSTNQHGMYLKASGFLIEGNVINGVPDANGISIRSAGTVRGNLVKNVNYAGIKYYADSYEIGNGLLVIEDNVVVGNNDVGIAFQDGGGTQISKAVVRFNTLVNNAGGMTVFSDMSGTTFEVYGNIVVQSNGSYFSWGVTPSVNRSNLTSTGDIGFVSFSGGDYQLKSTSLALNYVSGIPGVPPYDFLGNSMGASPYDAGAYQYVSQSQNSPPVLSSIGNKAVVAGSTLSFTIRSTDPDNDLVSYSFTSSQLPSSGPFIDRETGQFTWTPLSSQTGTYSVTFKASDGSLSDQETIQISVTSRDVAFYQENFKTALKASDDWRETGRTANVAWTISNGALISTVTGTNYGYSYFAPYAVDVSNLNDVAVEYDVRFYNSAKWGGLYYRGIYLDVNVYRTGWRDGSTQLYPGLSSGVWHHIIVIVHQNSRTSDLYVDGKPVFLNEPIQTTFKNDTVGFVSNYYRGSMAVDNFVIQDLDSLAISPSGLFKSYNFSARNFNGWIMSKPFSNINWSASTRVLGATVVGSGGYCYIRPYIVNVAGRDIALEYDVKFSAQDWGGVDYRGIHLDLNPIRYCWRDSNYQRYTSAMTTGVFHHIKLVIRAGSPVRTDLYVDNVPIFSNQAIEVTRFPHQGIGFASNYYTGSMTVDNVTIAEN